VYANRKSKFLQLYFSGGNWVGDVVVEVVGEAVSVGEGLYASQNSLLTYC